MAAGGTEDRSRRPRLLGAAVTWIVAVVVAVAAAHPERCHPPTPDEARAAARAAVEWLGTNQRDDGSFLYRYDRNDQRDLGGYNTVRHAGVLLSLAQAHGAGFEGAGATFRSGRSWFDDRLREVGKGVAPVDGQIADTGAVALLVAALVEWRTTSGGTSDDQLLHDLGSFLAKRVTTDGAVVALVDTTNPHRLADSRSAFSTGETAWALAALHTSFPEAGWDVPAQRVLRYLATERDDVERRFPPVSDHWSAYALAEVGVEWPNSLTAAEQDLARRQAGLFGLQVRYESQRRPSGVVRWTRGPHAPGAGVGTLGEGLGALHRLAQVDAVIADDANDIDQRLGCVAGLLVDRQATDAESAGSRHPERVIGAWFRQGVTQMDDQQHALSALLAVLPVLADEHETHSRR